MTRYDGVGIGPDENGEPIALVAPQPVELVRPARTKDNVETEQIESFLGAYLPGIGFDRADVSVCSLPLDDEDRRVVCHDPRWPHDQDWDIELTALTAGALRQGQVVLDDIARRVEAAVRADETAEMFLRGRELVVSDTATEKLRSTDKVVADCAQRVVDACAAALRGDEPPGSGARMDLGESADGIRFQASRQVGDRDVLRVVCPTTTMTLTEARAALLEIISAKDARSRSTVVVCTADPGKDGSVVPLDRAAHRLLEVHGLERPIRTRHVKRAWLHEVGSDRVTPIPVQYERAQQMRPRLP